MGFHEIVNFTAIELSRLIQERQLSCEEVMSAYLQQISQYNQHVNAIISRVPEDELLEQARLKDQQLANGNSSGWLHGLPLAPKDLTATNGIATTLGSPILKNNTKLPDSIVVERMRASGGIFIGKTNVPEFGLGSQTYNTLFGTTLNAYDQTKTSGGSSGGTSVGLALKMLPVADGSDFGGSLRNPAAWNNIYGLRPSLGRVPHGPTQELFVDLLPTEGPMARNVSDLAMMLSVLSGYDARTPLSLKEDPVVFTQNLDCNLQEKKLAWMGNLNGHLPMESGLIEASEQSLRYFSEIGLHVEHAVPQFDMEKLWQCWLVLRAFLTGGRLQSFYKNAAHRELLKPEAIWEIEQSLQLSADQVYAALITRSSWYKELLRMFETYDYLVLPSAQVFAFDATLHWPKEVAGKTMDTYHRWMEVVIGATLAGLPVLNIPAGFHQGVPFGLQVIGKPQSDLSLLQLGYAWQQATPFLNQNPPLLNK